MAAFELISGYYTAPGSSYQNALPVTGDTFQVKNVPLDSRVLIASLWANFNVTGLLRIVSPQLHDTTTGVTVPVISSSPKPLLFGPAMQELIPNDILTPKLTGSSTAGQHEQFSMLLYYENFPGISQNLIGIDEVKNRIWDLKTVQVSSGSLTANTYSGTKYLSQDEDIFNTKREYALLGYYVHTNCTSISLRGPDTSNTRIGMPGLSNFPEITGTFFIRLSELLGAPAIPLIQPENKTSTFIEFLQNQSLASVSVTLLFAALTIE